MAVKVMIRTLVMCLARARAYMWGISRSRKRGVSRVEGS